MVPENADLHHAIGRKASHKDTAEELEDNQVMLIIISRQCKRSLIQQVTIRWVNKF